MEVNQIYTIVNSAAAQALGSAAIAAVDTSTFVSLGDQILGSQTAVSSWLNTLYTRIGETIISSRPYSNKLRGLMMDRETYGLALQKIKVRMPQAEADQAWTPEQGGTVDHYKVNKLGVSQKIFAQNSPYQFHISTPLFQLREAFISEAKMAEFIAAKTVEVRNMIELVAEQTARLALATAAAYTWDNAQTDTNKVHFLDAEIPGLSDLGVTAPLDFLYSDIFLRGSAGIILKASDRLTDLSTLYNVEAETRHTPKNMQKLVMISDFSRNMRTMVEYAAYNPAMVEIGEHIDLGFWQDGKAGSETTAIVKPEGAATVVPYSESGSAAPGYLLGMLFDRDAIGVYHDFESVLTTPINAAGAYFNTYWHMRRQYFYDPSENVVLFGITAPAGIK